MVTLEQFQNDSKHAQCIIIMSLLEESFLELKSCVFASVGTKNILFEIWLQSTFPKVSHGIHKIFVKWQ